MYYFLVQLVSDVALVLVTGRGMLTADDAVRGGVTVLTYGAHLRCCAYRARSCTECDGCGESNVAAWQCGGAMCGSRCLCDDHATFHQKRGHPLTSLLRTLGRINAVGPHVPCKEVDHASSPGGALLFYCLTCSVPVCQLCTVGVHPVSDGHKVVTLDKAVTTLAPALTDRVQSFQVAETQLRRFCDDDIPKAVALITARRDAALAQIADAGAAVVERVRVEVATLSDAVTSACDSKVAALMEQQGRVAGCVSELAMMAAYGTTALESGNPVNISLATISATDSSGVVSTSRELAVDATLEFRVDASLVVIDLGTMVTSAATARTTRDQRPEANNSASQVALLGLQYLQSQAKTPANRVRLMVHAAAVQDMVTRYMDFPAMVEAGIGFLANVADAADNCARLMTHVPVVVAAMDRHGDDQSVVQVCVEFIANIAVAGDNQEPLMAHVGAVVAAMVVHDTAVVVKHGARFLARVASRSKNKAALMERVGTVVEAMARHVDHADVVSATLDILSKESEVSAHVAPLMPFVGTAVSAMTKHSAVAAVALSGLLYLRSIAAGAAAADLESLMGHLNTVVSTLTGHRDVEAVAEAGVGFLSNMCNKKTALRVVAHLDVVMSAMARHGDIGVVVERGLYCLMQLAEATENVAVLMAHVDAAVLAMGRHSDNANVARWGTHLLESLASESNETKLRLMKHVVLAVSIMSRRSESSDIVSYCLRFLFQESVLTENREGLMPHLSPVLAAMARYPDHSGISTHGVYFMYNLSLSYRIASEMRLATSGVKPIVLAAVTRHGGADAELKKFGALLLGLL